jgi:hypothetical protein
MYKGDLASYMKGRRLETTERYLISNSISSAHLLLLLLLRPFTIFSSLSLTHKLFQPSHISAKIAFHAGIWKSSKIVPYKGNRRRGTFGREGRMGGSTITARISILNLARGNYMLERSNRELGRNVGVWWIH